MTDTIEWRETIGSDAELRHATADELAAVLRAARASAALTEAVASGDRTALFGEFGFREMPSNHVTIMPGHEDDEPGIGVEPRDPSLPPASGDGDWR